MSRTAASFLFRIFVILALLFVLVSFQGSVSKASAGSNVWTGNGPEGGTIQTLVIDPDSPTTIYAGTSSGGVFKSVDSGNSWIAVNAGLSSLEISVLAINPSEPLTIYAGTPSTLSAGIRYGGVYKTSNGGQNWSQVITGLPHNPVEALAVDAVMPSIVYAGLGDSGVYKSTNGGNSWSEINVGLENAYVVSLAIDPVTPATLYAAGWGGIFKSTNSGDSWSAVDNGLPLTWVYALAINPLMPDTLYAGTREGQVFKSVSGGGDWGLLDVGPIDTAIQEIVLDPQSPDTIYAGSQGGGISKSIDGGENWSEINTGLDQIFINALAINPAMSSVIYAGSNGGVYKSINSGGNWKAFNTGLPSPTVYTVANDQLTPTTVYAGTSAGVFKSINGGKSWQVINTGLASSNVWTLAIDPVNSDILYAGAGWTTYGEGVFKSINGGKTWFMINTGLSAYPVVDALAIDPTVPSTLYAKTWYGVYKSINSGGNWTISNTGLPNPYILYEGPGALVIDRSNPDTLYLGMDKGIYKSINSGETWSAVNTGLPADTYVLAIAIDPMTPGRLYIGTDRGIFKSTDGGGNWVQIALSVNGIPMDKPNVHAIVIDPVVPTTLYADLEGFGVIKSIDRGEKWSFLNTGLNDAHVLSLAIHPSSPTILYAGTNSGVYTYETIAASPTVTSITRTSANSTSASSVSFIVTFSESVNGIDTIAPFKDFVLTTSGVKGAAITGVSGSGATYTVKVNTGSGNGTIRLDVKDDNSIVGAAGMPLGGSGLGDGDYKSGETYNIIKTSSFEDVPAGSWYRSYIDRLYSAGITSGCDTSRLRYCPLEPVTRAQMAVFLLRGSHTSTYLPPAPLGVFQDVSASQWGYAWINQLSAEGITYGCKLSPKQYCPNRAVTRAQMAIFLLRARHGPGYVPPKATGLFQDVPIGYWAADWIEQLAREGTTAGCSLSPKRYCPDDPITRAQMAVLLVRNFNLP
jgi:photosystem II stability/assembly factor-like uncharacterized protein